LLQRIEGFTTWFVDQRSLFGGRRHLTVVDKVTDELSRRRLVDVCRRNSGGIPVLCDEFGFDTVVIGRCVVTVDDTGLRSVLLSLVESQRRVLSPVS
jgi:lipoate-protein ligase A